jgi:hypothetical protein
MLWLPPPIKFDDVSLINIDVVTCPCLGLFPLLHTQRISLFESPRALENLENDPELFLSHWLLNLLAMQLYLQAVVWEPDILSMIAFLLLSVQHLSLDLFVVEAFAPL